jgi:hypothetical protein
MDSRTGETYATRKDARAAGVPERYIVELEGAEEAIRTVSRRVRFAARHENRARKARRKQQKASRRANR